MSKNPPDQRHRGSSASASEEEYIRLKIELAQTRAKTDTDRLHARQLISKRNEIREAAAKSKAESEEQSLLLVETLGSIKQLQKQLDDAEEERQKLWKQFEERQNET